jgi:hypothetical protein
MTVLPKAINFLTCTLKISSFTQTASGFNPKILGSGKTASGELVYGDDTRNHHSPMPLL